MLSLHSNTKIKYVHVNNTHQTKSNSRVNPHLNPGFTFGVYFWKKNVSRLSLSLLSVCLGLICTVFAFLIWGIRLINTDKPFFHGYQVKKFIVCSYWIIILMLTNTGKHNKCTICSSKTLWNTSINKVTYIIHNKLNDWCVNISLSE